MSTRRVLGLLLVVGLLAGALLLGRDRGDPATAALAAPAPPTAAQLAALRGQAALEPCPPGLGPELPAGTLPCLAGGPAVAVQQPVGRPAVVNLWAWWCSPCQRETPVLVDLAARAGGRLAVVGVASDPDERLALEFAKDFRVHYPQLLDRTGMLQRGYGGGLPVTLFLDPAGAVRGVRRGELPAGAGLDELVDRYLGVRL